MQTIIPCPRINTRHKNSFSAKCWVLGINDGIKLNIMWLKRWYWCIKDKLPIMPQPRRIRLQDIPTANLSYIKPEPWLEKGNTMRFKRFKENNL
jgi:hypothetical protein